MATGKVNTGGGNSGLSKIFKGLTSPALPREGDFWVKANITIAKTIFDKDFSLAKSYPNNSLVFYISSNSSDQGYRILTDLFGRSTRIDMFAPIYVSAYYTNGGWQYPLVSVYIGGVWTFLSGTYVDDANSIAIYSAKSMSEYQYNIMINSFSTSGVKRIVNKITEPFKYNTGVICDAVTIPLDGRKYVLTLDSSAYEGYDSPHSIYIYDLNNNFISKTTIDGSRNSGPSVAHMISDDLYIYVITATYNKFGGYVTVAKVDITSNTLVKTIGIGNNRSYSTLSKHMYQNDLYVYYNGLKISKTDLTITSIEYGNLVIDKLGRLIIYDGGSSIKVYSKEYVLIKTISINTSLNVSQPTSMTIDKNDNLIIQGLNGTNMISFTKFVKNNVNDTWTFLVNASTSVSDIGSGLECDIYDNIYYKSSTSLIKLNANLQVVSTITGTGIFVIEPCSIATDYKRNYYK
ncbi:hypothetical protein KTC96_24675 (plasmid) [Clostridium estertheticum]|uniref:hypothetical protein n=1 Tax=Clostridium estertheticum TaxID=238834 RepID=UPI001C7D02FA|nr:hypothetical protein [Clostridium estertheticum]MBX4259723.1 hypothetical protein [Clostridium estertheticum]WLC73310.1 hypothetical protein KTC96_24675 [Clostridium estertheticum]